MCRIADACAASALVCRGAAERNERESATCVELHTARTKSAAAAAERVSLLLARLLLDDDDDDERHVKDESEDDCESDKRDLEQRVTRQRANTRTPFL